MQPEFDRDKYKEIIKKHKLRQPDIAKMLTEDYLLTTEIDTVKSWTRTTNPNKPSLDRLIAIADICRCSIQDFFSDAEEKRQQITMQEITSNPGKYSQSISNAFLSTLPKDLTELLNYFQMLDAADRENYLKEIKEKALSKINGG